VPGAAGGGADGWLAKKEITIAWSRCDPFGSPVGFAVLPPVANNYSEVPEEAGADDDAGAGVLEDSVFAAESPAGVAAVSGVPLAELPAGLGA
jgi:hypothetical protein